MKIILATNNEHKKEEFIAYFNKYNVEILTLRDVGIAVDPEENGKTFFDNALIKAEAVSLLTNDIVLSDDSGLQINALDGFPGVMSARFLPDKSYQEKFIELNKMLESKEDRSASFACVLCMVNYQKDPLFFEGTCEGKILKEPTHIGGFGYDPIFFYPPYNKSFASLNKDEKNKISHRGKAIEKLIDFLIKGGKI